MTVIADHVFPSFSKRHPSFEKFGEISAENIALFKEKAETALLVDLLLDFWSEYGQGRFSDGLLYVCDPIEKKSLMEFFLPDQALYPLVISSFGEFYFTNLKHLYTIQPIYGSYRKIRSNFELLFENRLQDDEYLNDVLDLSFHRKAVEKLGRLEPDQIFGFEPAIALGGNDEDISMVKKFQMNAHLAFLSQLVELEER